MKAASSTDRITSQARHGPDPLEKLHGRWTLRILLHLNGGAHRFVDLRAAIPQVTANVLTQRLRALECMGLIERHYLPPPAARHVYTLAAAAAGLKPALDALADWNVANRDSCSCDPSNKEQSK